MKVSSIVGVVALAAATAEAGFVGKLVKGVFGGSRRDLTARDLYARDLFAREPTYENALRIRDLEYAKLYARAAVAPKVNEKGQITTEAFVTMINKKQMFPAALEAEVQKGVNGYMPPAGRAPCPADLADHPCDNAIKVLNSGKIPDPIMKAIQDPSKGWTKGGASAKGGAAAGTSAGGAGKGTAKSAVKASKRDAYPEAYYDQAIYERDAYPEAYYEDILYERDAYPEAYYEDALYERDAYPEASYDDGELYAREAEPFQEQQWYY